MPALIGARRPIAMGAGRRLGPAIFSIQITSPNGGVLASPKYGDAYDVEVQALGLSANMQVNVAWLGRSPGGAFAAMDENSPRLWVTDKFNGKSFAASVTIFDRSTQKTVGAAAMSVESGLSTGAVVLWDGFDGPFSEYGIGSAVANAALLTSGQDQGAGMLHLEGNGVPSVTPLMNKQTALNIDPSTPATIMLALDVQSEKSQNQISIGFGRSGTYQYNAPTSLGNGWPKGKRVVGISQTDLALPASHKGVAPTALRVNFGSQQIPYNTRVNLDALMAASTGLARVVIGFDDGFRDSYDIAYPIMRERNLVGQLYLPCGSQGRIADDEQGESRVSNKLILSEVRKLYGAGWGAGLDGTDDDNPMTTKTFAEMKAGIDRMRAWLIAKGFPADHANDICYPNGYFQGDANGSPPVPVGIPIMVSDGTNVVRFRNAANDADVSLAVQNNMTIRGVNVPDGVTVLSGGGASVTSVTLSQPLPAQAKAADAIDKTGQFYFPAIPNYLRDQCGILSARTTAQSLWFTRAGPGDLALCHPSITTSGKDWPGMLALINNAVDGGLTLEMYIHQILSGVSTGINFSLEVFTQVCDLLGNLQAQGKLMVINKPRLRALDWSGSVARMLAA